ncbi:MAG TPA: hypothetical protein DC017_00475 [Candidatus Wallbacteria bacterium]|nr:hypothetical protein [Candidatus Wallbacteria bacterium]
MHEKIHINIEKFYKIKNQKINKPANKIIFRFYASYFYFTKHIWISQEILKDKKNGPSDLDTYLNFSSF